MSNRLASSKSLYLKQHADNPVDWWPWGQEAFDEAKKQNKPVIISIGYSACHWCHVMAHECFEDDFIADIMNRHFVCIKVDREEHPEVDQLYMEAVQMITRQGGWPLNVFTLPDGRPFFGGTYFPPEDRGNNMVPWPQLLMRISDHFHKEPDDLMENANNILQNLHHTNEPLQTDGKPLENKTLIGAAEAICKTHDDEWGGFGDAPKFPPSSTLDFLFNVRATKACDSIPQFPKRMDAVINASLLAMARGGFYDQIGGGFTRYSVDKLWLIPHFEKMLYDNGQLITLYLKGYLRYKNPFYKAIVEETIEWLKREMLLPTGGFASAIDADSEGKEGHYYVWNQDHIKEVLGEEEGSAFCEFYNITETGNFEDGLSNPAMNSTDFEEREKFAEARKKLLAVREKRVAPGRDTKIKLSWNALVVKALAEAGYYLENQEYLRLARETAFYLWNLFRKEDGSFAAVAYDGVAQGTANLDDLAYFAEAMLSIAAKIDSIDPGTEVRYIDHARILADHILTHYRDDNAPGLYYTSDLAEKLVCRKKEWIDNATPCGNASMIHVLSSLYSLSGDGRYAEVLKKYRLAYAGIAQRAPSAVPYALSGFTEDAMGVVKIKVREINVMTGLQRSLAQRPWRRTFLELTRDEKQPADYILCVGTTCQPPESNPHKIAEMV